MNTTQKFKNSTMCLVGDLSVLLSLEKEIATEMNIHHGDWLEYETINGYLILKKLDDKHIHLIEKFESNILSKYSEFDEGVDLPTHNSTTIN